MGCPLDSSTCNATIKYGFPEIYSYIINNGIIWDGFINNSTNMTWHINILKWVIKMKHPYNKNEILKSIFITPRILKWIIDNM